MEAGSPLEAELVSERLYTAVAAFVSERVQQSQAPKESETPPAQRVGVAVSLSGGVDSMVIAFILAHMSSMAQRARASEHAPPGAEQQLEDDKQQNEQRDIRGPVGVRGKSGKLKGRKAGGRVGVSRGEPLATVAMHINYGNRGEADAEALYVKEWCARHNIHYGERRLSIAQFCATVVWVWCARVGHLCDVTALHLMRARVSVCVCMSVWSAERRMSESGLQRGVTARDEYEKLTREARYDLYKAVIGGQSK